MRKNKFLAALAIAACLATSVPFSVNAATPGQATDASKVKYGTVSTANQAVLKQLFDATYYKKNNPDLAAAGITTDDALFNHFVKCGVFEGRACCEGFNVSAYRCYPDLQAAFGDDIVAYYVHWKNFGQTEKRTLVTVEAAAAAGYTVKGVDGAVVSAPAAASTSTAAASTATSTSTEKVAEDAEEAELADGIKFDSASGKFYDTTKLNESGTKKTLGVADGYIAVGGKYYKVADKADAVGLDTTKYAETGNNTGIYVDINTKASNALDVEVKGVPTTKEEANGGTYYVLVDGSYYPVVDVSVAYPMPCKAGYKHLVDNNGADVFYVEDVATDQGFSFEVDKDKAVKGDNNMYFKLVLEGENPAYDEVTTVGGKTVYKTAYDSVSANANGLVTKKAIAPYKDFSKDDALKNCGETGIHKVVDRTEACAQDTTYKLAGKVYYNSSANAALSEDQINSAVKPKAGYTYVRAPFVTNSGYYKTVPEATAKGVLPGYAKTTGKDGKDVYYSTIEIDASVCTTEVVVAKDGYVLVGGKAYAEVKAENAFKAKDGYKVTKNADDGKYYYTK